MKEKVIQALKPKSVALGFSKEEIESVAMQIVGTLQDDATDEQINAQIDAVIPFLQVSQKAVSRIVNEKKKGEKHPQNAPAVPITEPKEGAEPEDKFDQLLKVIQAQNEKIDALVNKDKATSRRSVYSERLKELPEELQRTKLKDFDRMSFKDDSDFETFISEVEEEMPALLQGLADKGLSQMSQPRKGSGAADKQASDKEIEEVINQLNI